MTSRNTHDIIFRIIEIGVALWFPRVLCFRCGFSVASVSLWFDCGFFAIPLWLFVVSLYVVSSWFLWLNLHNFRFHIFTNLWFNIFSCQKIHKSLFVLDWFSYEPQLKENKCKYLSKSSLFGRSAVKLSVVRRTLLSTVYGRSRLP